MMLKEDGAKEKRMHGFTILCASPSFSPLFSGESLGRLHARGGDGDNGAVAVRDLRPLTTRLHRAHAGGFNASSAAAVWQRNRGTLADTCTRPHAANIQRQHDLVLATCSQLGTKQSKASVWRNHQRPAASKQVEVSCTGLRTLPSG